VQVNQDCQNLTDPDLAGRGEAQNETAVAQDPNDARRLVASANDYSRGDSNCVTYYSSDGGRSWRDSEPPTSFTRGTVFGGLQRKYWQAAGDPTVAWDTRGNAYLTCLFFDRGAAVSQNPDESSAFYVFRSTGTGGASWNFPGRPVAEFSDPAAGGAVFLDKELMAIDNHRRSPFRDRIYQLDPLRQRRHRVHLPRVLARLRRVLQHPEAGEQRQPAVQQHRGRPDAAREMQRQPVLAALHRPGRHAVRRLGELQRHRPAVDRRQPLPDAARTFDRRRQHVLGAGEGRRLL
jgi:hypothetical protein